MNVKMNRGGNILNVVYDASPHKWQLKTDDRVSRRQLYTYAYTVLKCCVLKTVFSTNGTVIPSLDSINLTEPTSYAEQIGRQSAESLSEKYNK